MPRAILRARQPRTPRALRTLRWLGWSILSIVTAFVALWQGYARSHLNDHRTEIEHWFSQTLNLPVHIQSLDAGWDMIFPEIRAHGLCLDAPLHPCALGAAALRLSVEWWAPWRAYRLQIDGPHATLQRERDGRFTLAGIPLQAEHESDPEVFFERLLEQRRMHFERGTLIWNDLTGRTRPLRLTDISARFDNTWRHKRFRFYARTAPAISAPIEGEFQFRPLGFHPNIRRLYGEGHISFPHLNLAAWAPYMSDVSNPIQKGIANINFAFDIHGGRLRYLDTQLDLKNLAGTLNLEPIKLNHLQGHVMWSESGDMERGYRGTITTQNLTLTACETCKPSPFNIETRLHYHRAQHIEKAYTRVNTLDLPSTSLLAQHIPLPRAWRSQLQRRLIEGTLDHLEAYWDAPQPPFLPSRFNAQIRNVGWRSLESNFPSIHGLSASIEGTPDTGTVTLTSQNTQLDWPSLWKQFPELTNLTGQVHWAKQPYWQFTLENFQLKTADGNITANGSLAEPHHNQPKGWIQLEGTATLHQAPRLLPYLPHVLPKGLLQWLSDALIAGQGDAQWRIQGIPANFPFLDGSANEYMHFDIDAHHSTLRFAPLWPEITDINGRVLLHKNRIDIETDHALFDQINIHPAVVSLTGIGTGTSQIQAQGQASGSITSALIALRKTPLSKHIPKFLDHPDTVGQLTSTLTLHFPLANLDDIHVEARSQFENTHAPLPDLPPLTDGHGTLTLNENGLTHSEFQGKFNGEPVQFTLIPDATDGINLQAEGDLTTAGVAPWLDKQWHPFFKGKSRWTLAAHLGTNHRSYRFDSTLKGLSSTLPAPLNKTADAETPLHLELERTEHSPSIWWMTLPQAGLQARWSPSDTPSTPSRGHIMLGYCRPQPSLPNTGWHISGQLDGEDIDLPAWWNQRAQWPLGLSSLPQTPTSSSSWQLPETSFRVDLSLVNMNALHPLLNNSIFRWQSTAQHAQARLINTAMNAQLDWNTQATQPTINLHFAHLNLPAPEKLSSNTPPHPAALRAQADHPPIGLPPLMITIDRLGYGSIDLGKLIIRTHTEDDALNIPVFHLIHPDSTFKAEGYWSSLGIMHWHGSWQFENTGNFLRRLKLYDGLKNGSGTITGALQWEGLAPLSNPKSLGGSLELNFKNGQFVHVEPGLAKLLGLSSLQALPKRLALDFRDVFSEGFLFNRIKGRMNFERAILHSSGPIELEGDSANLRIDGQTDLVNETQEFQVKVLPNLSGSIATATAFLINPIVGGATFFAQKVLQDPFEKAFSYHYRVTGTWTDPVILSTERQPSKTKPSGDNGS